MHFNFKVWWRAALPCCTQLLFNRIQFECICSLNREKNTRYDFSYSRSNEKVNSATHLKRFIKIKLLQKFKFLHQYRLNNFLVPMHQLPRSWVRSQHPSAQWNLRDGRWSNVEYIFLIYFLWGFFTFFSYFIQHCFICHPSDSTVPTVLGSKPRPVQLVHWQADALTTRLDLIRNVG